jgi:hypothetical protein
MTNKINYCNWVKGIGSDQINKKKDIFYVITKWFLPKWRDEERLLKSIQLATPVLCNHVKYNMLMLHTQGVP